MSGNQWAVTRPIVTRSHLATVNGVSGSCVGGVKGYNKGEEKRMTAVVVGYYHLAKV